MEGQKAYQMQMATTVKITEETSDRLDRLQAKVLVRTGKKPTKQELLEQLIRICLSDETLLVLTCAAHSLSDPGQGVEEAAPTRGLRLGGRDARGGHRLDPVRGFGLTVVVDTSVPVAAVNERDERHDGALAIVEEFDRGDTARRTS